MAKKRKHAISWKYNLKEYWSILRNYKCLVAAVILVIIAVQFIFLSEKWFFKIIIDNGTLFAAGELGKEAYIKILLLVAAAFGGTVVLGTIGRWVEHHFVNKLEPRMMTDLKEKYFNHILHLDANFHSTHKTGSMISRIIRASGAVEHLTDILIWNFAPAIVQIIIVSAALLYFDIGTVAALLGMAIAFIAFSMWMNYLQEESSVVMNDRSDKEKANLSDFLANVDSIKYFGKENKIKKRFLTLARNTEQGYVENWNYGRWQQAGQSSILWVGTFFIILFPLLRFLDGTLTIGTLVFIYTTMGSIYGQLFGVVHGIRGVYRRMADFEALFKYGKIHSEIQDKKDAKLLKVTKGNIHFKNVSFKYQNRWILRNFDLDIKPNTSVALVGPSGAGKSTIIKVLYRLYDLDKGHIKIDGTNLCDVKQESLRSELSIVPQECVLFDDTVFNNIRFSNLKASTEDVNAAIKFSQLDKVIKLFPKKEKTIVGERGVKLSGGEKQRVSIARALLANKKILVLDEATSALDSETEHDIQADLQQLMKGRTSIVIAHRLSTIMKCDKIVVIDKGRIVQQGKHYELIKKKGMYQKLWELQKGGFIE